jgi:hypothetical protein
MADPARESNGQVFRLDFDRQLMLQFRGSVVTSDAGLLACRELDDALGLTTMAGEMLAEARTGRNGRHVLVGLFRQSVFGRLAGYEDVNDAERLRHDPAIRWIVAKKWFRAVVNLRARWAASRPNGSLSERTFPPTGVVLTARDAKWDPFRANMDWLCG